MALKVVPMEELKLQLLLEPERTGSTVVEVCRRREVSRASYYRYLARYLAEGVAGLDERSRRPRASPGQIAPALEAEIVRLRGQQPRWGARRIAAELTRAGLCPPAVSTIHRALRRNQLVAPQPPRRARASKRFERPFANDLWQIDATETRLADGRTVYVLDCLDDHARFLLAAHAYASPSGEAAWGCFASASAAYGLPRQLLSDNHASFTGRLQGYKADFERKLARLGVELINAAPAHPQTLGKLERFHRTLKEWLADEHPAADLEQLQALLDRFRAHYNAERPHQGIGNLTPQERYTPGTGLGELQLAEEESPPYPPHALLRKADNKGIIAFQNLTIMLASRYAGATVRVLELGQLIHVYYGDELVRVLVPDRSRRYQPSDKPKGRRP